MTTHVTAHSVAQAESLSALVESQTERVSMVRCVPKNGKIQVNQDVAIIGELLEGSPSGLRAEGGFPSTN
eukprot:1112115-Amphidinium_carterae.1